MAPLPAANQISTCATYCKLSTPYSRAPLSLAPQTTGPYMIAVELVRFLHPRIGFCRSWPFATGELMCRTSPQEAELAAPNDPALRTKL